MSDRAIKSGKALTNANAELVETVFKAVGILSGDSAQVHVVAMGDTERADAMQKLERALAKAHELKLAIQGRKSPDDEGEGRA